MGPEEDTAPDLMVRRKRALYRAEHRGTKELDFLLGKFAREQLATMAEADLAVFEQLLLLPEPQIEQMIMTAPEVDCGEFVNMINRMRRFHGFDSLESG